MKKIKNLFMLLILSISIFAMNFTVSITNVKNNTDDFIDQLEFVSEELSDVQDEMNVTNGFSKLSVSRSYGDSTYTAANMINYNLSTKTISYENFNKDSYENRNNSVSIVGTTSTYSNVNLNNFDYSGIEKSESYMPEDIEFAISPYSIIGSDDRTQVLQTRDWPYRGIVKMYMTFNNVLNQNNGKYYNRTFIGTGFMEGPNLMVTAGHCGYDDVTKTYTSGGIVHTEYEDNIDNPRFPDRIQVYAGLNGYSECTSSYVYYAEVSIINIQKQYFETTSTNYDWSAMQLDRDLGIQTGYYGKISNWYKSGASVYSYGYPGDKPDTMWETHGNFTGKTDYKYKYNFDTVGGQSGSPVFMTADDGSIYVCGIHTSGGSSENYATRINSFIYHYLNSFVTYHNYEHLAATILPTDYGFADAYPTDDYTKTNYITHTLSSGFQFQTRRYRTGYIHNEYVVMSPFRNGITEAFIEYKFDVPVSKIEVDLSHWRSLSHEWTYASNCTAVLRIPNGSGGYTTVFDLLSDATNLPTDRTNPATYTIEFSTPVYSFQFYMQSKRININDNNRGRVCIGNMNIYTKEGWY